MLFSEPIHSRSKGLKNSLLELPHMKTPYPYQYLSFIHTQIEFDKVPKLKATAGCL